MVEAQPGAFLLPALDGKRSSYHVQALLHGHQPQPAAGAPGTELLEVKASAVVLDSKKHLVILFLGSDGYHTTISVFSDIRQGFLYDAVNNGLHRQGKQPFQVGKVHLPGGLGNVNGKSVDRGWRGLGQT